MHHLAILVCAISIFLLGAPWYSKAMFLNAWSKANGIDPNAPKPDGAKHPAIVFGVSFLMAWVAAYAFAWLCGPQPDIQHAVYTGLLCGMGIAATSFAINYQFANKPVVLLLIDGGYHIVQFLLYAVILGLWH